MKDLMQKTIELLKHRVNRNLEIIRQNQKVIKEILKEPVSDERSDRLKEKYDINKNLLHENNDFINMQLNLINFIDKYKNSLVLTASSSNSGSQEEDEGVDYFELTVSGSMPYDARHPFFDDEDFYNELLQYYQDKEDYEMCGQLVNLRKK